MQRLWHCLDATTPCNTFLESCFNHSLNGSSDSVNGDLQFLWE